MRLLHVRCERCHGNCYENDDGDRICLLCGRSDQPAPAPIADDELAQERDYWRNGRRLSREAVTMITSLVRNVERGSKTAAYEQIAGQFGVSVNTVRRYAGGWHK